MELQPNDANCWNILGALRTTAWQLLERGDHRPAEIPGTLTFASGEDDEDDHDLVADSKREGNETFYLDLFGNSSNSSFTKNRGLGTILNDD